MKEISSLLDIPYGSRIVIYGGGRCGEDYFRKIKISSRAEIVAVIDAQAEYLPKIFDSTPVYEPGKICRLEFDYVLITVRESESADSIRKLLNDYRISDPKILWINKMHDMNKTVIYEIMKCFERNIENEKRRFFLFMLPEHGNLGDYAIGYAESAFLKKYFVQYDLYGVTTSEWLAASEFYLNLIKPDDVIFINGGGYLGDLWGDAEIYMRIIESFPQNIKIFFPNTLTYQKKPDKKNEGFRKDMEWFRNQQNLFTFFREYPSYHLFHQYDKRSRLFPDMAFFLQFDRKLICRNNKVLLCLRDDRERTFKERDRLENSLKSVSIDYDVYDIYVEKYISQQAGKKLLEYTIRLFQTYDCIITDRLHGMILSVVSNVPCIAFDNLTHKISGVFESIRDLQYVQLITENDINDIGRIIAVLYENKKRGRPYRPPITEFKKMADRISEIINGIGETENGKYC